MLEKQQKKEELGNFRQNKKGSPLGRQLTFERQARIMEQNARKSGLKAVCLSAASWGQEGLA